MKKLIYLIVLALILGLVLTGCLLSNIGQAPTTEQSGIAYLTKNGSLPGLVGWWRFNGDATDSSGNDNDGIVYGDKIYEDSSPIMGKALSFDGINNYVSVGDIGITGDWTVELWANLASTNKTIYYPIGLSPASPPIWGSGIFLAYSNDKWGVYDGVNIVWGTSVISTNTWYHFAVTKSGTTYTLFLNGDYESTGSLADIDVTDLSIGRRSDTHWYFNGSIDDVRIWNVALPQEELGKVYDFKGFFPPVDNDDLDDLNVAKAGRAIPVKFSLGGDQGLKIFEVGYPKSTPIACPEGESVTADEIATVTAGGSSLSYDATEGQYTYVWKTNKAWTGCRKLIVKLVDGTYHYANFKFK
jgi:hypothetical protein